MVYIRDSILATLIYYDILDFPLTMLEVYKYLINPERLSSSRSVAIPRSDLQSSPGVGMPTLRDKEVPRSNLKELNLGITLGQVRQSLDDLVSIGHIGSKNGFYFLPGRDALYELRIEKEKIAAQKWKKFLRITKWFQAVPYLRAILASGSLAMNNTDHQSDFDVLAVARSGRLYTCRIFLSLAASLFGARRTRYEKSAPDKFCFNHYITDKNMNIRHESLYNAQTYANLKPVMVSNEIFSRFYTENIWLNKYIYNFKLLWWSDHYNSLKVSSNVVLMGVRKIGEFILNFPLGDRIEDWAKKYQQKRIKKNPATYESGGRVVFNDNELEFHPRSFEAFVVDRYNKRLKQLGIIPYAEEKDSGLTA